MALAILMLVGGFLLLGAGAEALVRGAGGLAIRLGIAPILVGLTVVSLGTSAPELAVSIESTMTGHSGLALGNVVGSNIANIGLVLGTMALVHPLKITQGSVRRDIPVVIGSFVLMLLLLLDEELTFVDGLVLTSGLLAFIIYSYYSFVRAEAAEGDKPLPGMVISPPKASMWLMLLFIVLGLALLVGGSHVFVNGAIDLARLLGVSEAIIGLTLVAIGTSIPELATCLVAAWRRQTDLAIGNVIGSNIFNVLGILGITSLVGSISAADFSWVDFGVAMAFSLTLLPLARSQMTISRAEGALLLVGYCVYLAYLEHIST